MSFENNDSHKKINFEKIAHINVSGEGTLIRGRNNTQIERPKQELNQENKIYFSRQNINQTLNNLIKQSNLISQNYKNELNKFNTRNIFIDYMFNPELLHLNISKNYKNEIKKFNCISSSNNEYLGNKQKRKKNKNNSSNEIIIKIPRDDKSNNTSPSSNNVVLDQINCLGEIRNLILEIDNKYHTNRNKFQKIYYFTINTSHYAITVNKVNDKIIEISKEENNIKSNYTQENEISKVLIEIKGILESSLNYYKNNVCIN